MVFRHRLDCSVSPHSPQDFVEICQQTFPVFLLPRRPKSVHAMFGSHCRKNTGNFEGEKVGGFCDYLEGKSSWDTIIGVQPGLSHQVHLLGRTGQFEHSDLPKYSITLYDNSKQSNKKDTVAILIPFGQESDWLFQTIEGNQTVSPNDLHYFNYLMAASRTIQCKAYFTRCIWAWVQIKIGNTKQ